MWDLFDYNNDGKTSLFEKVVGIELLESTFQDDIATKGGSESYDHILVGSNSDEFDEDYENFDNA